MARLTVKEKNLLRYPPTQKTWRCKAYVQADGEKRICGSLLSGLASKCHFCGKRKPARAELVYPEYVTACKKAGIEPGERWRESDIPPKAAVRKNVRRKGN